MPVPYRSLRRPLRAALALVLAGVLTIVAMLALPRAASAAGTGYYVTFVARSCPSYDDIFANRARNDIQESLKDLGPPSPYSGNFLVDPSVEDLPPQDVCSALPHWKFTMGTSYESRAVTGPWGSLSKVTDPFDTRIVTKHYTPLYDEHHAQIGDQLISGATTIELTQAEREQANSADQLWVQGGTPDDPVLADKYPGPQYGFAALRCAVDDLNGDNVEYVYFPAGVTHVFCYAFYVLPPPTSGTITIEKRVVGAPAGEAPSFHFNGSLSFDPDGFSLANGQSQDFYRAGANDWQVTEDHVDHYRLTSVNCTAVAADGGPGTSTSTVDDATTTIGLVADEHVTCIYTNTYREPSGGLSIDKITRGGVGAFHFTVRAHDGSSTHHAVATTTEPGVPAAAAPSLDDLSPGDYSVREYSPHTDLGRWHTVAVHCTHSPHAVAHAHVVHVIVHSGEDTHCVFVNRFIPAGSIAISKISHGQTGTFAFLIQRERHSQTQYLQHATTMSAGASADATPATPADATNHLQLGEYLITEQFPPSEPNGAWSLDSIACNGVLMPFERGTVHLRLTQAVPSVHCTFVDSHASNPDPPTPPHPPDPPTPTPPPIPPAPPTPAPPTPDPAYAKTDLSITKQALTPVIIAGHAVTYRITVRNHGPDAAERVVVTDGGHGKAQVLSARPSRGRCEIRARVTACLLGNLKAGAHATIISRVIPDPSYRRFRNTVVVGSATAETKLANNRAHAIVKILHPPKHIVCPSARGPKARAAC